MANIFTTILNMSLTASIIILIVLLARLCLKKVPKIFSYILWGVVLFRLLCPVSFSLPVSMLAPVSEASTTAGTGYIASMEYISIPERIESEHTYQPALGETPAHDEQTNTVASTTPEPNTYEFVAEQSKKPAGEIALTILGWLWVAGMAGVLGFTTWQTLALKRKLNTAFLIRGNIFESEQIDTAFVLGVFNPKIYLPLDLPFDIQKAVIAHEQTHQRRGDHIVKLVSYAALAVHWFNPLVWLSFKLMCDDMEKSCDEAVIRTMNDRGYSINSTKKAYGHMLLALGGGKQHIFSPVSFAENSTKARVKNLVAYNRVAKNTAIALAAVCALVVGLCVVNPTGVAAAATDNHSAPAASDSDQANDAHDRDAVPITFGDITVWSDVTELDLSEKELTDISNIRYCTNLRSLNLTNNYGISDISALSYCTSLVTLKAASCDISDISVLSELVNLEQVDLSHNHINDITALRKCSKLTSLNIFGSFESDGHVVRSDNLRLLAGLPNLTSLSVDSLEIESIPVLSQFASLKNIAISGFEYGNETEESVYASQEGLKALHTALPRLEGLSYGIFDYDFAPVIASFDNLSFLDIQVDISDEQPDYSALSHLAGLSNLKTLHMQLTSAFDFDFISELNQLESLSLLFVDYKPEEGTVDLNPISACRNLKEFNLDMSLRGVNCVGLEAVISLPNLETLCVYSPGSTVDLSLISAHSSFTELDLNTVDVRNFDHIRYLENLKYLRIADCSLKDSGYERTGLEPLRGFESLETLVISAWQEDTVVDLSFASNMKKLKTVDITAGSVTGVSGLKNSTSMTSLLLMDIYENEDFSELCSLTELNELVLGCAGGLDDLSFMEPMVNLTRIQLEGTFAEVDALSGISSLQHISLHSPELVDVKGLAGCQNAFYLEFFGCGKLNDTSPLKVPNNLRWVNVVETPNCDLSFVSWSKNKVSLDLSLSQITDYSFLFNVIGNVDWLSCDGSKLSAEQVNELRRLSPECDISGI